MITQSLKYDIKYTFEKLQEAYDNLKLEGSQDYFLTLGNVNEVYLMRKDAKKSIFLGRLFDDANSSKEIEARKIWTALQTYFRGTVEVEHKEPAIEKKPVEEVKKTTRKSKKVVEESQPVRVEPEVEEEDEESSWVDTVL